MNKFQPAVMEDGSMRMHNGTPCIPWPKINGKGYGLLYENGKKIEAHRAVYIKFHGMPPEGMVLDHLCRTRNCINPSHLEPVTKAENSLRGVSIPAINARKTHCDHGHFLSGDNVRVLARGSRTRRVCVACQNIAKAAFFTRRSDHIQDGNAKEPAGALGYKGMKWTTKIWVDYHGEQISLCEAARRQGIKPGTVYMRRKIGWTIERALNMEPSQ